MRTRTFTLRFGAAALSYAALALAGHSAVAAEYWLRAGTTTVQMPNPNGGGTIGVAMWGYAQCSSPMTATCGTVTVPGPALTVPPGDSTLTVHLLNTLAAPTSLVIHGLVKTMAPVWTDGSSGPRGTDLSKRVRSFDAEAAPNGTADYTWPNVGPGTYLYQSGTQPQVQVQMGLYGAVTKNFADATTTASAAAYAGVLFDNQAMLLYSEIDPALHAAVATGAYGTAAGPTSTIGYAPKYFLVNGQPFPNGSPVISPAGNPGTTLLRFLNAGLTTHVPMIQGTHWTLVAEDGKPSPWRRNQYTALLPAAKTVDVLLTPDSGGAVYPIVDRRLSLSNNGLSDGGMLAFLSYAAQGAVGGGSGSGNAPPIAANDTYASIVGVTLNVDAGVGLLVNDNNTDNLPLPIKAVAASGATTAGGTYAVNTNGSFTYTPPASITSATADSFNYQVTDGSALSAVPGTVTINLTVPSVPTLASVDDFNRANSTSLGANWSQTAATGQPPDIQIAGNTAKAVTTDLGGLAIWNSVTSFGAKQGAGFSSATPLTHAGLVLKASGGTAAAPANYVRVRCEASNGGEVVVATMNGGSNVTVFVKQAALAATGCTGNGSLSAVVDAKGLVTAFLNGAYVGGVQLPDVAAWKGPGYIGIQLQTVNGSVDNFGGGTLP
jgi:FtsP/CotA-like multicopper oxidase with cupredoxin domain